MPLDEKDCAATYKVLIMGEHSVGKTAILDSLMGREFRVSMMPTVGVDFVRKIFEVDGALVQLLIWDTSGQEKFRSAIRLQYRGVQGVVLVYDITNPDSFSHLSYWIDSINNEIRHKHSVYEPIPIVLCGNKVDLAEERRVETCQGEKMASQQMAFEFFETSAKCGKNVFQAFQRLAYHVTDICDPKLMKSYHPFMIRQEGNENYCVSSRPAAKQKKKTKANAARGKINKCSLMSATLCCIRGAKS